MCSPRPSGLCLLVRWLLPTILGLTWLASSPGSAGTGGSSEPLAHAYQLLRDYRAAEAEPLLQQILVEDPTCLAAHRELGLLYAHWYRYEEAEQHLTAFIEAAPDDPAVHYARGTVRFSLLDWDGALADFEAVAAAPRGEVQDSDLANSQRMIETIHGRSPGEAIEVRAADGRRVGVIRNGCSSRRGEQYAELLARCVEDVERFAGRPLPPVGLVLLSDSHEMDAWNEAYCGQASPGCAFHNYRIIVLNAHAANYDLPTEEASDAAREAILEHELVHHLIDTIAGPHSMPKWFHEGVADYLALPHGLRDPRTIMQSALAHGQTPYELVELFLLSRPEDMDRMFYRECAGLIAFIGTRSPDGDSWILRTLDARRKSDSFDAAFESVCGMSKEAAFQQWEKVVLRPLLAAPHP